MKRKKSHKEKKKRRKFQKQINYRGPSLQRQPLKRQIRWKRLSHHPRPLHHRHSHARPRFNHWVRNMHRHHDHLASSLRDKLHNHIEKTRRQWLSNINPHEFFRDSFPSFPEIPNNILNAFPALHPPLVPSFKHRENTESQIKNTKTSLYQPTHRHRYNYETEEWKGKPITTPPSVWTTSKPINGQRKFFVTQTQTKPKPVTLPSKPSNPQTKWDGDFLTKSPKSSTAITNFSFSNNEDESAFVTEPNLVSHKPNYKGIDGPRILNSPKSSFPNQKKNVSVEVPKTNKTSPKNEAEKEIYIPYENDVTKGKPNLEKEIGFESDWEWVPLHPNKNDVNYENDGRDEGTTEWEIGGEKGEEKEQGDQGNESEDPKEDEDKTLFDIDQCLECPPKRKVHAPRGHDLVPLLIPTPKDSCRSR